ncbi:hypothetical protein GIB67_015835 [Kingdonia uniflora]|uniref:Uncharacterized protein n=1 Tax=Kingdonia uniflora TaxID=39325 RepID=A0A7J7NEV6_9MAGN|nr:hypothetical protein GIB67_015835 [Kingdonia uniflora]
MVLESNFDDMFVKVGMFLAVQALVYFILSNSSNVFSNKMRSLSFKASHSSSFRRVVSDISSGGEDSPSILSWGSQLWNQEPFVGDDVRS